MTKELITITDIYNKFAFEWIFASDSMKWQAPVHLLLGETSLYESGDHFANRLTLLNLDKRLSAIHEACRERTPYSVEYEMQVQGDKVAKIKEQGRVFFNPQGQMLLCRGYIHSTEIRPQVQHEYFSTPEIIQHLNQILEANDTQETRAAFVYLCVDRMFLIGMRFGVKAMHRLMEKVQEILNIATREYDFVGRISGTSFGIILQNCNHTEIIVVAKRLIKTIEETNFEIDGENINLNISIGGCVIEGSDSAMIDRILNHSERALLDAQHIKKIAIPTAHVAQHLGGEGQKNSQNRRREDREETSNKTQKDSKSKAGKV